MKSLRDEIRQQRPFRGLEHEAVLSIARTADRLGQGIAELLQGADLTPTQYNVLRILRGAGTDGMAAGEVGERLVARGPDVTRLLDRLERRRLLRRDRCTSDRRVVTVTISEEGLALLAELDGPVAELHFRQVGHLGEEKLRRLIQLLEEVRHPA